MNLRMTSRHRQLSEMLSETANRLIEQRFWGCPSETNGGANCFREICPDGKILALWRCRRKPDPREMAREGFVLCDRDMDLQEASERRPIICVSDSVEANRFWQEYCSRSQWMFPLLVCGDESFVRQSLYDFPFTLPLAAEQFESTPLLAAILRRQVMFFAQKYAFRSMIQALLETQEKTFYLMEHDCLTGILNRFGGEQAWMELDDRMRRSSKRYVFFLADIDYFKKVNDSFGHAYGDEVLKRVAASISRSLGPETYVFRFGGEEIAGFRPVLNFFDQQRIASKVMHAVRDLQVKATPGADGGFVTVSVGVTIYDPDLNNVPREEILKQADLALYEAKCSGRNRYEVFVMNRKFARTPLPRVFDSSGL